MSDPAAFVSRAVICHCNCLTPNGTCAGNEIVCAPPAARETMLGGNLVADAPSPSIVALIASSSGRSAPLRTVTCASKRSPSRTNGGKPANSITSCVVRIAAPPEPNRDFTARRVRNGLDAKRRQRIVQRHFDSRATVLIERDARVPHQQRVEQLARVLAAAAAACRHRLLAEVALADHLRLRGRRFDFDRPPLHHRAEQIPRSVRRQSEQSFIDRGDSKLGIGHRLAVRIGHGDDAPPRDRALCKPASRARP